MDEVIPSNIWRILLVDDDEDEYCIARSNLNRIEVRKVYLDWAATYEEGVSRIQQNCYDAVLVDYDLGAKTGIELIREMTQKGCSVPLILYTGRGSFEVDLEAMQAGATSYLIKSEATPLFFERSIRYAIERKRIEEDLDRHLQERSAILDSIQGGFIAVDRNFGITYINHAAAKIRGFEPAGLVGRNIWEVFPDYRSTLSEKNYRKVMEERLPVEFEMPGVFRDKWYNINITPSSDGILIHWQDISARKQGEAALHRYELLSENSRDIILYLNLEDGRILEVNAAAVKAYGYTREELLQRTVYELRVPELQASIANQIAKANMEGILFETVHRRKDGNTFPVEISAQGATIDGKRTLISVIRDITERKRSDALMIRINKALRESQNKLKMIVDSIADGFYVLDQEFRFTYVNAAAVQYFGLKYQEIIGRGLFDLFPAARHTFFEKEYRHALQSGEPAHFETRSAAHPDKVVEMHAYPGPEGLTVLFRDITERHQAETALRESEEKYRSLFNNMTEGFAVHEILLDGAGQPCDYRFLEVNPAFELLTGLKRDEILGKTYNEVLGDGEMTWIQKYGQVALTGNPIHFENYSPSLRKHYEVYAYRSAPYQFAVIFIDVTPRKRVEEALRDANQTLQEQAEELEVQTEQMRVQNEELFDVNQKLRLQTRLFQLSYEPILVWDLELGIQSWNEGCEHLYGFSQVEAMGKVTHDLLQTRHPLPLDVFIDQLMRDRRWTGELRHRTKVGREVIVESRQELLEIDGRRLVLETNRDITNRKQAEVLNAALTEISQILHSTLDVEMVMQTAVSASCKALGSETAAISLRKSGRWLVSYVCGFPKDVIGSEMDDDEERHAVLAIQTRKPVAINDAFHDERVNREHMREWGIRSVLVVPILLKEEAVGVIFFNYQSSRFEFQEFHIQFGVNLAADISLALENARLFGNLEDEIVERKRVEESLLDANQTLQEQAEELEVQAEELRLQTDELLDVNERLIASEENYRRIVETANEGIWITDKASRTILVNPKMADMLGYTVDEMMGVSFYDFVDLKDIPDLDNRRRKRKKGIREQYELQLKCKDDRKIWVMVNGSSILEGGKLVAHLGMMMDITKRKRVEEDLRHKEERLVDYLESMNELFFSIDFEDRFIYANRRYCETLGLNQKETIGKNFWELFPRYLGTYIEENYRKAMDERVTVSFPMEGIYTDRWYEVTIYPIQEGIAVFVTDRTEAHKAEVMLTERTSALQEYAGKLEQSNKALEDFAFIASHDLKEPLRKINTFGSLILSNYKPCLDEQGQDYIRRMQDAAGRMQRMLDGLLDYSKVTTQGRPFAKIDLTELTHSVISDLDVRVQETEGQIDVGELPVIEGDRMQIRQLMQNLIGNALKFHRDGVPPLIKIYQGPGTGDQELGISDQRLEIAAVARTSFARDQENLFTNHQSLVTILVQDNGIGFDMKNIDFLFQPFNRLVGRSDYEGSGMGLAICRKIAERHGGSINAFSIPGEGSTFIVTLPGEHRVS